LQASAVRIWADGSNSGTYNYLYDGNGSVIGLTNSQGQLVNQYAYDPYGNRTSSSGTAPDYFGFQGGYLLPSGLYHFGARYYNSADERWTQEDPLANIGSFTQGDRYSFAGDDPINASDPTGDSIFSWLKAKACILAVSAACGGGLSTINEDYAPDTTGSLTTEAVTDLESVATDIADDDPLPGLFP
jgi:RHS repeat-associated protein